MSLWTPNEQDPEPRDYWALQRLLFLVACLLMGLLLILEAVLRRSWLALVGGILLLGVPVWLVVRSRRINQGPAATKQPK